MWKLEFEDGYFRIYDSTKLIAGYFDPDYGDLSSTKNPDDVILSNIKNHDQILGGMIMIPLVKFKLFDIFNSRCVTVRTECSRARVAGHGHSSISNSCPRLRGVSTKKWGTGVRAKMG